MGSAQFALAQLSYRAGRLHRAQPTAHVLVQVLRGVGENIAARDVPKILMLNGSTDRETSQRIGGGGPMTAVRPSAWALRLNAYSLCAQNTAGTETTVAAVKESGHNTVAHRHVAHLAHAAVLSHQLDMTASAASALGPHERCASSRAHCCTRCCTRRMRAHCNTASVCRQMWCVPSAPR